MKTSLILIPLLLSLSAHAHGPVAATIADLNGIVAAYRCSGALVTLGRADTEKALVLTAGHCTAPGEVYASGTAVANVSLAGAMEYVSAYTLWDQDHKTIILGSFPLGRIVYATMTRTDVTIFEAEVTIGELKRQGYAFFELADRLPKPGEKLRLTSGLWGSAQDCEVERIFEDGTEEARVFGGLTAGAPFRNSILLKSSCSARGGFSGSPLLDMKARLIYGVTSRIATPPGGKEGVDSRVVLANAIDLRDCLTRGGEMNYAAAGCKLPRPR